RLLEAVPPRAPAPGPPSGQGPEQAPRCPTSRLRSTRYSPRSSIASRPPDTPHRCDGRLTSLSLTESTSIEFANVEQAARVEGTCDEHRAASIATCRGA